MALERDRASYAQARALLVQASAQISLVEAQLAQAQAQLDSSKANSDYLQRTFERNSELFYQGRGVISKQDLDTAQSQAEVSVATDKANLAAVNVASENVKVAHAQEEAARSQAEAALAQVRARNSNFPTVPSSLPFPGASPKKRFKPGTAF
jgi:multidrug resistance efflux pump